jgi:topoisomerase-4 subunit A
MASGIVRTTGFDTSTHFDEDMFHLEKHDPEKIWTLIYLSGESGQYYVKRFQTEASQKNADILPDPEKDKIVRMSGHPKAELKLYFTKDGGPKNRTEEDFDLAEFIGVKSHKAKGKRLTTYAVRKIELIEPELPELPEDDEASIDEEPKLTQDQQVQSEPAETEEDTGTSSAKSDPEPKTRPVEDKPDVPPHAPGSQQQMELDF